MSVFIEWPLLAAVPGLLLLWLFGMSRRSMVAVVGVAWLVYAVYELGMRWRVLCTGECNIRIDLLLIYPLLVIFSGIALMSGIRARARRSNGVDG